MESLTASLVPEGLGRLAEARVHNLTAMLDAFFTATGFHINVNVLNRDMLLDCHRSPREISPFDDPGVGLRGELRPAHPRAADGRDQSHVLRRAVMIPMAERRPDWVPGRAGRPRTTATSRLGRSRIVTLDWMRGLVMVLMVIDHASMAFDEPPIRGLRPLSKCGDDGTPGGRVLDAMDDALSARRRSCSSPAPLRPQRRTTRCERRECLGHRSRISRAVRSSPCSIHDYLPRLRPLDVSGAAGHRPAMMSMALLRRFSTRCCSD